MKFDITAHDICHWYEKVSGDWPCVTWEEMIHEHVNDDNLVQLFLLMTKSHLELLPGDFYERLFKGAIKHYDGVLNKEVLSAIYHVRNNPDEILQNEMTKRGIPLIETSKYARVYFNYGFLLVRFLETEEGIEFIASFVEHIKKVLRGDNESTVTE